MPPPVPPGWSSSPEPNKRADTKRLPWPKYRLPSEDEDHLSAHIKTRLLADTRARPETIPPSNPTVMGKPFWNYMIAKGDQTYGTNQMLGLNPFKDGPSWCFDRLGRSTTWLPDGRVVLIGGEHEDFYDPDFCIYNDVVVIQPREEAELVTLYMEVRYYGPPGLAWRDLDWRDEDEPEDYVEFKRREVKEPPRPDEITIYGYPPGVFPPTDGHVAVYVKKKEGEESIYVIGGVGYTNSVHRQETCVFRLDLSDFSIEYEPCEGELPPHEPKAVRARRAQVVGKEIITREENGEKYALNMETLVWRKLTEDVEFELEAEDVEDQYMEKTRPVIEDIEEGYL